MSNQEQVDDAMKSKAPMLGSEESANIHALPEQKQKSFIEKAKSKAEALFQHEKSKSVDRDFYVAEAKKRINVFNSMLGLSFKYIDNSIAKNIVFSEGKIANAYARLSMQFTVDDTNASKPIVTYCKCSLMFDEQNSEHDIGYPNAISLDEMISDVKQLKRNMNTEDSNDKWFTCCFCGKLCKGYGNNPAPLKDEGRCCDDCNASIVVPERIKLLSKMHENEHYAYKGKINANKAKDANIAIKDGLVRGKLCDIRIVADAFDESLLMKDEEAMKDDEATDFGTYALYGIRLELGTGKSTSLPELRFDIGTKEEMNALKSSADESMNGDPKKKWLWKFIVRRIG